MKIKTKKQLNLPQLIEWAWENKIKGRMFLTESDYCVGFDRHGFIYFNSINSMPLDQTFTVEVEEEITEDTKLEYMIEIYKVNNNGWVRSTEHRNVSIYQMKNRGSIIPFSYYILNDDLSLTLIWTKDKGLVE